MGRELSRIVRDLPIRDRPRGRPARRLRPGHGRPALPRVRVPDAHRTAAADGRRIGAAAKRQPAFRGRERLRPGRPRRRPARGLGRRPGRCVRPAERRAAAPPRLRLGRRDGAGRSGTRSAAAGDGAAARAFEPADDLPDGPGGRDGRPRPDRGPRPGRHRRRWSPGWRPSRPSASRSWPTTRDRAAARRWRWRSPAPTAGSSRSTAPRPPTRCAGSLQRTGIPLVGHEVKAAPGRRIRRGSRDRRRCRSPSTRRSPPTS